MAIFNRSDFTIPNVMTCFRILMAITAGWLFINGEAEFTAALLCIAASLLDYFDGWYARKFHQKTRLGAHLDPFADKVLIAVIFAVMSFKLRWNWFSLLVSMILMREVLITVYRIIVRRRLGTFVPTSKLGKIKTTLQCIVGDSLLFFTFIYPGSVPTQKSLIFFMMMVTFFITIDSGLRYILPSCSDGKKRSVFERLYQWIFGVGAREM